MIGIALWVGSGWCAYLYRLSPSSNIYCCDVAFVSLLKDSVVVFVLPVAFSGNVKLLSGRTCVSGTSNECIDARYIRAALPSLLVVIAVQMKRETAPFHQ
jgi:hypothetical protein